MPGAFANARKADSLPESQEVRSMRNLERLVVYGETDLPLEFAKVVTGYQEFKLGVIGRFRAPDDSIVTCRYVELIDGVIDDDVTRAVGQIVDGNPYQATQDPALSDQGLILGVAMVQGALPQPCFGWVQVSGIRTLTDAVDFAFGDTVYWHDNGSITDNPTGANGVVGIALGGQVIFVHPWFGMPKEAMPPYLISDITGLQLVLDNLADAIEDIEAGEVVEDPGVMIKSLDAEDTVLTTGVELDFEGILRSTHTMQVIITGAPATCVVEIHGFLEDWIKIGQWSLADGFTSGQPFNVYNTLMLKTRAYLAALTGGTAPTVTATLASK